MLRLKSCLIHTIINPINIRIHQRIRMIAECFQLFIAKSSHPTIIYFHHIIIGSILVRISELQILRSHIDTSRCRERNLSLTFCTTFGCNQDNTIGTTYTNYSRSWSVFQHSHALNFIRINLRKVTFYTINLNQRFRIVPCSDTTHINICCIRSRLTGILYRRNTGDLPG